MSHWRDEARAVIESALRAGRAQGLEGKALERFVSGHYPFGPRANHPYQIWLSEFRRQVRGEVPGPHRARPADLDGQGMMFSAEDET